MILGFSETPSPSELPTTIGWEGMDILWNHTPEVHVSY